jgi:hypothetical protein
MNLEQMEALLDTIVQDKSLKPLFMEWLNDTILELASDYDFPPLRQLEPVAGTVNSSSWLWAMPENYHKNLFRCAYIGDDGTFKRVTVHDRISDIEYRDHTKIEDLVTSVAVGAQGKDHLLGIFPLPQNPMTLYKWYYRKPTILEKPGDTCDCIPPEYHERVIIPRVLVRNYQTLLDQVVSSDLKPIAFWEGEFTRGLKGAPGGPIGLLNYFAKTEQGRPRRLGGRDPVGWSPYRYVR